MSFAIILRVFVTIITLITLVKIITLKMFKIMIIIHTKIHQN